MVRVSVFFLESSNCFDFDACLLQRKAASAGFKIAKERKDTMWTFNLGFLTALAILVEGSTDDARIAFRETNINARKLERDDCALFIQKVYILSGITIIVVFSYGRVRWKKESHMNARANQP